MDGNMEAMLLNSDDSDSDDNSVEEIVVGTGTVPTSAAAAIAIPIPSPQKQQQPQPQPPSTANLEPTPIPMPTSRQSVGGGGMSVGMGVGVGVGVGPGGQHGQQQQPIPVSVSRQGMNGSLSQHYPHGRPHSHSHSHSHPHGHSHSHNRPQQQQPPQRGSVVGHHPQQRSVPMPIVRSPPSSSHMNSNVNVAPVPIPGSISVSRQLSGSSAGRTPTSSQRGHAHSHPHPHSHSHSHSHPHAHRPGGPSIPGSVSIPSSSSSSSSNKPLPHMRSRTTVAPPVAPNPMQAKLKELYGQSSSSSSAPSSAVQPGSKSYNSVASSISTGAFEPTPLKDIQAKNNQHHQQHRQQQQQQQQQQQSQQQQQQQQQRQIHFKAEHRLDSDIFSELFQMPSQPKAEITKENHNINNLNVSGAVTRKVESTDPNEIQIQIHQSEMMSCVYDSEPNNTPTMDIKGSFNIKPTTDILGRTFFIALEDPDRHLKEVTSFFEIAKEVTDLIHQLPNEEHPFVKKHQEQGNRIYKVTIPQNIDCLSSDPFQILKYTGSEFLRPIPLLVSTRVRVAGKVCRVGVKIRSNPSNKQQVKNAIVLVAIPPDVNGESVKMSIKNGAWDPLKRVIVYKCEDMKSGETVDMQLQFEYLAPTLDAKEVANMPRFPVMVRCEGFNEKLSSIELKVGGTLDDVKKYYALKLDKTYKLFHRKI